jgi:hypothetical protein
MMMRMRMTMIMRDDDKDDEEDNGPCVASGKGAMSSLTLYVSGPLAYVRKSPD